MALTAAQIEAAIYNRRVAKALSDYTATDRVYHTFIGDSNAMKDDYGWVNALAQALSRRYGAFGTGIIGAKHYRSGHPRGGGGIGWAYYSNGSAMSGGAVRNKLDFTGATWNHGTLTLSGTFTGFTGKAGDLLTITGGTNAFQGDYTIVSGNSTTIVLGETIGASATTGISGSITPASGASSFSSIPTDLHKLWNMPDYWQPYGACMVYKPSGTTFAEQSAFAWDKAGPIPCNGPMVLTVTYPEITSGGSIRPTICHYDGGLTSLGSRVNLATPPTHSVAGTTGDLNSVVVSLAAGDRVTSSYGSNAAFVTSSPGQSVNDTGPCAYLFHHVCALNMSSGTACQGFMCRGGRSVKHMLDAANFLTTEAWTAYLTAVGTQFEEDKGGSGARKVVFWINSGFNDHVATSTSADGVNSTTSALGFKANTKALIQKIKTQYDLVYGVGASDTEVVFIVMPSHPISDTPSTTGTSTDRHYREGLSNAYVQKSAELCDEIPNVIVVDLRPLLGDTPTATLNSRGLTYGATGDPDVDDLIHLSPGGYDFSIGRVLDALDHNPYGGGIGPYTIDPNLKGSAHL